MTPEKFDACFDRFSTSVFRLETLPAYDVGGAEGIRLEAFRNGTARPERSVRTDPWLARIARTTIEDHKRWQRVHVVDEPLTEYLQYELIGYVESQACGEQVRIAVRNDDASLRNLPQDYWLYDGGTENAYAVAMEYDAEGHVLGYGMVTNPARLAELERVRQQVWNAAVPLNEYIVGAKAGSRE